MTVDPPDVQPSLGDIALMHGVATGNGGYRPAVKKSKNVSLVTFDIVDYAKKWQNDSYQI